LIQLSRDELRGHVIRNRRVRLVRHIAPLQLGRSGIRILDQLTMRFPRGYRPREISPSFLEEFRGSETIRPFHQSEQYSTTYREPDMVYLVISTQSSASIGD
jgi:hypothetical protein